MRIYLDSKDLINIVERQTPIPLVELGQRLRSHDASLVVSFSNITELAAPLATRDDVLTVRHWLNNLETVTPLYIAESYIQVKELESAIHACDNKVDYAAIDPFVRRFDSTLRSISAPDVVNYRLSDIVLDLWTRQRDWFDVPQRYARPLRALLTADRQIPNSRRKAKLATHFANVINRYVVQDGLAVPPDLATGLAPWIYDLPRRCPGIQLSYQVFHQLAFDPGDLVKDSDLVDIAQMMVIPYVDAMTVDKRMLHYFRGAAQKLKRKDQSVRYADYVYSRVEDLIAARL